MNRQRLQKILIAVFHFLFITTPFFFTWVNEELFEFPKMLLTYGFTVVILSLWVTRMIFEKRIILRQTIFDWPILFFLISQTLSTIFSIHPQTSIMGYYTRFHGGLLSTLTYVSLFYALVSNFSKQELKKLWLTIFITALGVSLYAIPEHFGHSASCLMITQSFDVSCWVQDVKNRVFATFGQPNWLAAYTITLIPLGIVLFSEKKKLLSQLFFGITTLALFTTLIFTQSRSGLIGLTGGMLVLGSGLLWLKQKNNVQARLIKSAGLVTFMALLFFLLGSNFSPSIKKLLSPQSSTPIPTPTAVPVVDRLEAGGTDSGEIRKIVWQGAINIWKRYPLLGSGVETFAYSYYQDRPLEHNLVSEWDFLYNKAHNELLNFLANSGIVGLGSYLILLGWFGLVILRQLLNPDQQLQLADQTFLLALLAGTVALSISNFFGFSTVVVSILLFTNFSSVAILLNSDQTQPLSQTKKSLSTLQIIQLVLATLISLFLLNKVFQIWKADKSYATGKAYIQAGYASEGVAHLQTAIEIRPKEALYHSQLASSYSQIAVALEQKQQSTAAAEFTQAALQEAEVMIRLNPRHLNFHKARAKVYINLSPLNSNLLAKAKEALLTAIKLAPTDAKLLYNLGLVELSLTQTEAGIKTLEETVLLKPDYEAARLALGKQYQAQEKNQLALEQYQYIADYITKDNQEVNQKIMELK